MLDTFPLARIATVPVPLKFTQARAAYTGAEPDALNWVSVDSAVASVPALSGRFRIRSELLFGLAMVNVPVPLALGVRAIRLMLFVL
jgi:hypothetical protein